MFNKQKLITLHLCLNSSQLFSMSQTQVYLFTSENADNVWSESELTLILLLLTILYHLMMTRTDRMQDFKWILNSVSDVDHFSTTSIILLKHQSNFIFSEVSNSQLLISYSKYSLHDSEASAFFYTDSTVQSTSMSLSFHTFSDSAASSVRQDSYLLITLNTNQGLIQVSVNMQSASKMTAEKCKCNADVSARLHLHQKEKKSASHSLLWQCRQCRQCRQMQIDGTESTLDMQWQQSENCKDQWRNTQWCTSVYASSYTLSSSSLTVNVLNQSSFHFSTSLLTLSNESVHTFSFIFWSVSQFIAVCNCTLNQHDSAGRNTQRQNLSF